jgi:hypothetical protein
MTGWQQAYPWKKTGLESGTSCDSIRIQASNQKGMKTLDISDHYPVWTSFYVDRDTD